MTKASLESPRRGALAWFIAAVALYGGTAARGPMWADSSKLTLYALHSYFPSLNPGDHAGWTVIARAWLTATPFLDPARSLNLLSALCGAVAVALSYLYGCRRTGESGRGHAAAAVVMLMLPVWWASTLTESYAIAWALTLAVALLERAGDGNDRRGFLAGLAAGVAAATHVFTLFVTGPLLFHGLRRHRLIPVAAGLLVGTAPLWAVAVRSLADPLTGYRASGLSSWTWHLTWFLNPSQTAKGAAFMIALLVLALGPLGLIGLNRGWRTGGAGGRDRLLLASLGVLALTLTSYAPYRVHLMTGMLLVGIVIVSPPLLSPIERSLHLATQAALYLLLPVVAQVAGHDDLGVRRLPRRNNAWYFLCPVKAFDRGPERYALELLTEAPAGAAILSDFNPGAVVKLVQEQRGMREDLLVTPTAIDDALASADPAAAIAARIRANQAASRPVVLADTWEPYYRTTELGERFGLTVTPCGPGVLVGAPRR